MGLQLCPLTVQGLGINSSILRLMESVELLAVELNFVVTLLSSCELFLCPFLKAYYICKYTVFAQ